MKGEIFGIPLLLIVPALITILAVDVPLALLHSTTTKQIQSVQAGQQHTMMQVEKVQEMVFVPSPTATPSATPTITKTFFKTVVTPSSK